MISALLFGSREWPDPSPIATFLRTVRPDLVVHGACGLDETDAIDPAKMRGADGHAHRQAVALGIPVDPHPAHWRRLGKRAGMVRNGEMAPLANLAAGWSAGRLGTPVTRGSADMAARCRARGTPVVVYREGGIEPDPTPLRTMRRLHEATSEAALIPAWHAVNAWKKGEVSPDVAAAAVRCAAESAPRWAPWLDAVAAACR